jgi:hypothetical protein
MTLFFSFMGWGRLLIRVNLNYGCKVFLRKSYFYLSDGNSRRELHPRPKVNYDPDLGCLLGWEPSPKVVGSADDQPSHSAWVVRIDAVLSHRGRGGEREILSNRVKRGNRKFARCALISASTPDNSGWAITPIMRVTRQTLS